MFKREVKSIADIVNRCLRENGLESPLQQTHVVESWDRVAGAAVARYTVEKYIRNQTLFVKISNPALRAYDADRTGEQTQSGCRRIRGGRYPILLNDFIHLHIVRFGRDSGQFLEVETDADLIGIGDARQQSVVIAPAAP